MLGAARAYAEANQATLLTPFILAGAMAPVTAAAVCAQTLAEALAGMTFVQLVRPGAPVVLGTLRVSMSMQSGAPTFGTPEPALVLYVMAALARRLGVPFRSGGSLCASKIADAQAAYEIGGHVPADRPRWRQLRPPRRRLARRRARRRLREVHPRRRPVRDDVRLRQRRRHVGERPGARRDPSRTSPGTHYLGSAHTLANFESAFYRSEVADNNSYEQWQEDGSLDAAQRANAIWKRMLAEYEAPPIDPGSTRRSSTSSPGARRPCRIPRSSASCCFAAAHRSRRRMRSGSRVSFVRRRSSSCR